MIKDPTKLVEELIGQHRKLQKDLQAALGLCDQAQEKNAQLIFTQLLKFKIDLNQHLDLENNFFYPDFINKKKERGEEVSSTQAFIGMMDEIGEAVLKFLEEYNKEDKILVNKLMFKNELQSIISALNTRIETEEEGIYGMYLLM